MKLNAGNENGLRMEGLNSKDFPFKNIKDFVGETVPVKGFYFTKGKYGEQVVVIGNGVCINMPQRAVLEFQTIFQDEVNKKYLLAGKIKLTNIKPLDTNSGKTTAYDIDADVD